MPLHRPIERFVLVVGNARSGTTLVGAILDSHPAIVCANESRASTVFWRDFDRDRIVAEIWQNSARASAAGRSSAGYAYRIAAPERDPDAVTILADKVWNPALLLLAGQRDLIASLADRMACPVVLVHVVRNPFDAIATMHRRSGASLRDRFRWYHMHCLAFEALIGRAETAMVRVRHEELVAAPRETAKGLFARLGQSVTEAHLDRIEAVVFGAPRRTRAEVDWPPDLVADIDRMIAGFDFLRGYDLTENAD